MAQLPQRPFWEWASGWVFGITGIAITLGLQWFNRKRPKLIICREVAKTSLVRIQEEAGEHITVQFDKRKVGHLAQLETELINDSKEEINNIDLTITFGEGTTILRSSAKVIPEGAQYQITRTELAPNAVKLQIPYFNSSKLHRQRIRATFICDGAIEAVRLSGGGAGWSVKYQGLPTLQTVRRRMSILTLVAFSTLLLSFALLAAVRAFVGTYKDDISEISNLANRYNELQMGFVRKDSNEFNDLISNTRRFLNNKIDKYNKIKRFDYFFICFMVISIAALSFNFYYFIKYFVFHKVSNVNPVIGSRAQKAARRRISARRSNAVGDTDASEMPRESPGEGPSS